MIGNKFNKLLYLCSFIVLMALSFPQNSNSASVQLYTCYLPNGSNEYMSYMKCETSGGDVGEESGIEQLDEESTFTDEEVNPDKTSHSNSDSVQIYYCYLPDGRNEIMSYTECDISGGDIGEKFTIVRTDEDDNYSGENIPLNPSATDLQLYNCYLLDGRNEIMSYTECETSGGDIGEKSIIVQIDEDDNYSRENIAKNNLGILYCDDDNEENDAKGFDLIKDAAESGISQAQANIAIYYYNGGCSATIDKVQSAFWNRKAAEAGHIVAQGNLGYMLYFGDGIPINEEEGLHWLEEAKGNGDQDSIEILNNIIETRRKTVNQSAELTQNPEVSFYERHKWKLAGVAVVATGAAYCYYSQDSTCSSIMAKGASLMQSAGSAIARQGANVATAGVAVGRAVASQGRSAVAAGSRTVSNVARSDYINNIRKAASFGRATITSYRTTFFRAFPSLEGEVVVHHAVPQEVMKRFPGLIHQSEMNSLNNLRGIPSALNSDLHLSKINRIWNQFYRTVPSPTKQQLLGQATKIDNLYGHLFKPAIR
jgi:TPR repeat protein